MKKLLSMLLAVVMVLSLGAFALADDPVEINFWSMWNEGEPQADVIAAAAEAYEAETGVHVNIEWKGRDINQILTASLKAGDAIDIFEDDYDRIGHIYAEYTYDLTDMAAAADYDEHSFAVFRDHSIEWAGYLNSISEQPQVGGIYYDKDAFAKAGIETEPTTWAEFLDACAKLKDAGIAPLAQDSAYTNFSFYYHLVRYIGEDGIAELRDNGGWADNEKAVQAAQDIIDLIDAGYFVDGVPDEYPASENKIGFGQAAMVVCANYVTPEVNRNTGTEVNWGLLNYPAVEGGEDPDAIYMGSNSLAVTSYSEHPQEAFDFIMFLVTGEYDKMMADTAVQIPADPNTEPLASMASSVELLKKAEKPMGWCTALNGHEAWQTMKGEIFPKLFEGEYKTGEEFCAAMDALY